MSRKSTKRGVLVRGDICDVADETNQDIHEEMDHACSGDHSRDVHEKKVPDIRKKDLKFVSKGKHLRSHRNPGHRSPKTTRSSEASQSHDNPGFLDDDGSIQVTDSITCPNNYRNFDQSDVPEKAKTKIRLESSNKDGRVSALKHKRDTDTATEGTNREHYSLTYEHKSLPRYLATSETEKIIGDGETDNVPSRSTTRQNMDTRSDTIFEASDNVMEVYVDQTTRGGSVVSPDTPQQHQACVDNVQVIPVTHRPRPGPPWPSRPHSRSMSFASPFYDRTADSEQAPEAASHVVPRSQSMRVPTVRDTPGKVKVRTLLRDLSFSDADAVTARNYGTLRGGLHVPRRRPLSQAATMEDDGEDIHAQMGPELKSQLSNLMHELLGRGKVRQVALLAQDSCSTLVSVPPWDLAHRDEIGLVKAVTSTTETMTRLAVGHENYTFFKHGPDKVMGRAGDTVLVAQRTKVCVVVGVADDSTPGSCLYEVSELVKTMEDHVEVEKKSGQLSALVRLLSPSEADASTQLRDQSL